MSTTRSLVSGSPDGDVTSDRVWALSGSMANFSRSRLYDGLKSVKVCTDDGLEEEVLVDDELGPVLHQPDGRRLFARMNYTQASHSGFYNDRAEKTWPYLTSTEREVLLHMVAKMNRRTKEKHEIVPVKSEPTRVRAIRPPSAGRWKDLYKLLGRSDDDNFSLNAGTPALPST
mmetsp:Transcript_41288/g.76837  ORF Transcript_41288/g.76837 Transcript_41288/m.76837 type:complete len:173 (+) Transcript_41288:78-596(+)